MVHRLGRQIYLGLLAITLILGSLGYPAALASDSRGQGAPVMAVVSLSRQKVTIYDAAGKMMEAPVSTGQSGYETPAGLYSVIERKQSHYSNIYENAPMPFMHRITWSGIALHAGALPGYPASHGCVRLPYGFAGRLFDVSRRGMRVAITRDDMAPVDFAHPALFKPAPQQLSLEQGDARIENASFAPESTPRLIAAAKAAAADDAAERFRSAKAVLRKAKEEAGDYLDRLDTAEETKRTAQGMIAEADEYLGTDVSAKSREKLAAVKSKAQERLSAAQAEIDKIYAEGKAKIDAVLAARTRAKAAWAASNEAEKEARQAALTPVSVFISRKTQRLYVRQSFEPLFESGVTIRAPNAPIGTTLYTAVSYLGPDAGALRWTALSMSPGKSSSGRQSSDEPISTDSAVAAAVLDRIIIPPEALARINELVAPGSSLIVSDEAMSRETSKGTDFVIVMSGSPQGGIRRRSLRPDVFSDYDVPSSSQPFGFGAFSWW